MLTDLHIQNLAVLSEASVGFGAGFNVLTGETGAGKSIVVDSLALLSGARAQIELIRTGADTLRVSGVFSEIDDDLAAKLEEAGIAMEDAGSEIVIRREVHRNGRNRIFINDQPVTLRLLARIAPSIIRIHGQREELGLAQPELQRAWLDRSGGKEAEALLATVAATFVDHQRAAEKLASVTGNRRIRDERRDLLTFQVSEIDGAAIETGEDVALRAERDILRNAEEISSGLHGLLELVYDDEGSATERLASAAGGLGEIDTWEPGAAEWRAELDELRVRLEELVATVRARADRIEPDPARLQTTEDRLAVIERLCRKYGDSAADVLRYRERIGTEIRELATDDDRREELEADAASKLNAYADTAKALSERRTSWGESLADRLRAELADLAMPDARLEIRLERRTSDASPLELDGRRVDFGEAGVDHVVFLFSPNPGEELRPLARVASGGELSRVYLALQLHGAGRERPTLVFDEVDSGVGGVEALVLGRKLSELSRTSQILTVTHLAQVASQGDRHFRIRKKVDNDRTFVAVSELERDQRVAEISRMLGGEGTPTETSLSHAEELLAAARA